MTQVLDNLEQQFYDQGTNDTLIAYAKALDIAGDALGKLITMELEADLDPEVNIVRSHPEINKLRAKILKPHLQPKVRPTSLKWNNGLVVSANVGGHIRKQNQWLEVLLSNRSGRAIRQISFKHSKESCNYKRALKAIVEKGTPNLRELDLSQRGSTGFDGMKGLSLSAPRLEVMRLCGKMNPGALKALGTVWPNLHTLVVDFDLTPVWEKPQSGKKLAKLFAENTVPKLRFLRLERTGLDDTLLDLIANSGVVANLESLQIGGFFTKESVDAFITQIPQSCQYIITSYTPQTDHQSIVDIHHRGITSQQNEEYASLWEPLQEVNWWESGTTFEGAVIDHMPRNASLTSSKLPDGTLHGRQSKWQNRNGETTFRYDSMYWYGVEHGPALLRNGSNTEHRRFINGLRDERVEQYLEDGTVSKSWVFAQGVKVEDYDRSRDQFLAKEEALFKRFGKEFITETNPLYNIGSGKALSAELQAIPQIAKNLNRTDDGMKLHDLEMKDGSTAQVVLWTAGDTTCGVILEGSEVLGLIEDLGIFASI